jgi:nucleotidyltransferase DUF2204
MILSEDVHKDAHPFYREALAQLQGSGQEFLVGGGFAFCYYTGISRYTKDLDIFCRASQCAPILQFFGKQGYRTEMTDVRWLAKVFKDEHFMDIIFDSPNNICSVDDTWFKHSSPVTFRDLPVRLIPVEELIWCKAYVQNRERFDGADINHLLLHQGKTLDWDRLLFRLDRHWQLLLAHLLVFQFVYPSEYQDIVPRTIIETLLQRVGQQYEIPAPVEKVCRGPLIDQTQYATDIVDWHYKVTTIKTV